MPKFRKKPVVIEAVVFEWGMEDGVLDGNQYIPKDAERFPIDFRSIDFPGYLNRYDDDLQNRGFGDRQWQPYIQTLEGKMIVSENDWIITDIKKERYPCKPDIFEKSYEPAE